jgi:hypothetical protein
LVVAVAVEATGDSPSSFFAPAFFFFFFLEEAVAPVSSSSSSSAPAADGFDDGCAVGDGVSKVTTAGSLDAFSCFLASFCRS